MDYHFVTSVDELSPDNYGLREPPCDAPMFDPALGAKDAVCFVPGLVYV